MTRDKTIESSKLWQAIVWTLRITVVVQCLGNWRWLAQIGESPLLSLIVEPRDVCGLAWSEATGLTIQQSAGWLVLLAGFFVMLRPCAAVLGPLCLLQLLFAVAMWHTHSGYTPQASWLPPQFIALFPLATQSARIAAPLALLLLDPWRAKRPLSESRIRLACHLSLVAIALTFFAHGIEALEHNAEFVDLLIVSSSRLLGNALPQANCETLLTIIGGLDLLVAVACLVPRFRSILWWMAFWGAVTALSRITAFGWESAWHAAATRFPHLGLPLAVVLHWHLVRWIPPEAVDPTESA
ncbi:MAG: hypothetical protein KDA57_18240 [Planctomycetales bacterium]|nr:hypothetical protein [Planctomycetales bacterium]